MAPDCSEPHNGITVQQTPQEWNYCNPCRRLSLMEAVGVDFNPADSLATIGIGKAPGEVARRNLRKRVMQEEQIHLH